MVPNPPALGFAQIKNLLLTECKPPVLAADFEGIQHVLVSVCFQRCFACGSLHMRTEISQGKKDGCREAARMVSSRFLSLLASKAAFGVHKGSAGIMAAKEDCVCHGGPAVCLVCWQSWEELLQKAWKAGDAFCP